MELGINYKKAQELVDKYITDKITKLHLMESEAIMRALARYLWDNNLLSDEDKKGATCPELVEGWGIIGLLHDIDWDLTKNNVAEHCVKCAEILKNAGGTDYLIEIIQSHGWGKDGVEVFKNKERSEKIQHALAAAETLTGLIVASALVQPDKKLTSVKLSSLQKKFKNKSFAAKCNREIILECEKIGLSLDEFLGIGLRALQGISDELGL